MNRALLSALVVGLLGACAPIRHGATAQQEIGKPHIAGVGDVVLRVEKYRNMENAFGKADLFGRKTKEGYSEIRFAGVEPSGEVVLYRKDLSVITNESTMTRTPVTTTTGRATTTATGTYSGYGNAGRLNATSRTTYSSTTIAPLPDFHVVVPGDTIPIRLSPEDNTLPVDGYVIEIIRASRHSLEYRITER